MSAKRQAIAAFHQRKERNAGIEHIDNATLWAGSPMHYYCRLCGEHMMLPETHRSVAPRYCGECITLIDTKWVDSI